MNDSVERPGCVLDAHLDYLDKLRDSAITNMFGAGQYLRHEFPLLPKDDSYIVLEYWMRLPRYESGKRPRVLKLKAEA